MMNQKNFFKALLAVCLMAMCWMPMAAEQAALRGDVDDSGTVGMDDVTALINYLLTNDSKDVNLANADCDGNPGVGMDDLTELINYLLTNEWSYVPYEPVYEVFTVSNVTFRMVYVEGGTFMMGGRENDPYVKPWELPVHEVTLSDYYIGETEVTQALWRAVMGTSNNPSWFTSANGYTNDYNRPVEKVTYANCKTFITKLNQKTGRTFRMLTDAEWEYAARGGKYYKGCMYPGSDDIEEVAWHNSNSGEITHAVGTKAPNELGIYDMGGNVGEWVSDRFGYYTEEPQTNPTGPTTGTARVVRGGSWNQSWRMNRVTYRHDENPVFDNVNVGLRLALVQ